MAPIMTKTTFPSRVLTSKLAHYPVLGLNTAKTFAGKNLAVTHLKLSQQPVLRNGGLVLQSLAPHLGGYYQAGTVSQLSESYLHQLPDLQPNLSKILDAPMLSPAPALNSEFVKWGYFAVSLHVQVLMGLMYPSFAQGLSSSIGGFATHFFGSALYSALLTYGMILGHETFHTLEAARTNNLRIDLQDKIGTKLAYTEEGKKGKYKLGTLGFWKEIAKMTLIPLGKYNAVERSGLGYKPVATPTLGVLAAGPRFDRRVSWVAGMASLPLFGFSVLARSMGWEVPEWVVSLTPKLLALFTMSAFGKYQDNNALAEYSAPARLLDPTINKEAMDQTLQTGLQRILLEPQNVAEYPGDDPRFKGMKFYGPYGGFNVFQAGKHTEFESSTKDKGNFSPDVMGQEKWIILESPTFYDVLESLPKIQAEINSEMFRRPGVLPSGNQNEGGSGGNFYGGGDIEATRLVKDSAKIVGEKEGLNFGENMWLGWDNAADSDVMFDKKTQLYNWQGKPLNGDQLLAAYKEAIYKIGHLMVFEDPFAADKSQWKFWQMLTEEFGKGLNQRLLIIGDDIVCTRAEIAKEAIEGGVINAGLTKANQAGSLVQTHRYQREFHKRGLPTMTSHRSTQPGTIRHSLEETVTLGAVPYPGKELSGRPALVKWGGLFLENRAALYNNLQRTLEAIKKGEITYEPMGDDVTIKAVTLYPAPLGSGKNSIGLEFNLSKGQSVSAPIPGGLSRGERETKLLGYKKGFRVINELAQKLGIKGMPLSKIGDPFEIERLLIQLNIQEAQKQGQLPTPYSVEYYDQYLEEAAFKHFVGGDVTLALGFGFTILKALREGVHPWYIYRLSALAHDEKYGDDPKAFYEPIFKGANLEGAFLK